MVVRIVGFIIMMAILSCNDRTPKTKPLVGNITESIYAAGIVKSETQYQVFSTVTGIISKILVTENDEVRAGDPLIVITDETSRLNRENARIAANYTDLSANKEKLIELRNNIDLARSKYSNDSLLFKRQENLWNQGIGTKIELEQKELSSQHSKTDLATAIIRYNDLSRELQFKAEQSRNNLAISAYHENDFIIKSEINGKIYSLLKEAGEIVNPQTPVAVLGGANDFILQLQVDENDIVKVKKNQLVMISMDSYKNEIFEAVITKIDPLMDEHTNTFSVEARFVKQPPVLYPNLTVEANIIIQTKENTLIIPRNYLIGDSLVLSAGNKTKPVVTGLKDYQNVEIVRGLSADEIIYKPGP